LVNQIEGEQLRKSLISGFVAVILPLGLFAFPPEGAADQADTRAKQDIKDAGHSTKRAVKKTGSATKKESKKVVNKSAKATRKAADKVEDKTEAH
jgi:hypothetical protein